MFNDHDDTVLYPLLGFRAGVVGGAVVLRFDFATGRKDCASGEGESQQFVMTPEAAIDIGKALQEQGLIAGSGAH